MRIITSTRGARRNRSRRRGVLILAELLFVFPVLMMFFLGVAEYYMLIAARINLENASRAAVRVAAAGGYADKDQVNQQARETAHAVLGGRLSEFAHVKIIWSQDLPPEDTFGQADWVEARVAVRARSVIPDVLGWLGFSLGSRELVGDMRMKQE
jgi:TadE-like protein